METKEQVLQNCKVEGTVVKLPDTQLDRKLYLEVAKSLELIGGKWKGGKTFGFVFPTDPTGLLEQISNGEKRNLKKEFQFFGTPNDLADELVEASELKPTHRVLEPSAGQGAIIKAINRIYPEMMVECFELMDINRTFLSKINTAVIIGDDFLQIDKQKDYADCTFDRIIANPPFSKNQDIDHIRKMYDCLKPKGRLVSIASKHWLISTNKKETAFRIWLDEVGVKTKTIPDGRFKSSGTSIGGMIIIIDKN